jgi:prepilin-type processing-associated H-X9-DG protein
MGFTKNLTMNTDPVQLQGDMDNLGVIRNFLCPAQASTVTELPQLCWLYANTNTGGYTEQLSYVFNEYVLGYDDNYGRLRGQASQIRQPALTMFAMDGLGGSTKTRLSGASINYGGEPAGTPKPPWPTLSIWNDQPQVWKTGAYNGPITLGNALTKYVPPGSSTFVAGDPDSFDQIRHKGKMNVAFFDGHVEVFTIPAFTESPITSQVTFKNDPGNANLANDGGNLEKVYIKAP